MARVVTREQLPRWSPPAWSRPDRPATDDVPVGARALRADRIVHHRGDTSARHYHVGCDHAFFGLEGAGSCT